MPPTRAAAALNVRPVDISNSEGFALCTPSGQLLGHTYRQTVEAAIASIFYPAELPAGWSVEAVYARIFIPRFYVTRKDQDDDSTE